MGPPGNFVILLIVFLLFAGGGMLMLVIGGILAWVLPETDLKIAGGSLAVFGLGTSCLSVFILIPTFIFRWRYNSYVKYPQKNAMALGPDGLLILGQSILGDRTIFYPWKDLGQIRRRSFNTLGHILTLSPSLLGPALGDNYKVPLSVISHAIQVGMNRYQEKNVVSGEEISKSVDPEQWNGQSISGKELTLVTHGVVPENIKELATDLGEGRYYFGVSTYCWNRSPNSLLKIAIPMLLTLPLLLPALVLVVVFIIFFIVRGDKAKWFVAFLPDGLLIQDARGIISVPWKDVQSVQASGRRAIITSLQGPINLDCEFYRLTSQEFVDRCDRLKGLKKF